MDKKIDISAHSPLRVGTDWISVEVISEPGVLLSYRGYAPVLLVIEEGKSIPRCLYIAAKSIAEPLEEMRRDNDGEFSGLKFRIRKVGAEKTAAYEFS